MKRSAEAEGVPTTPSKRQRTSPETSNNPRLKHHRLNHVQQGAHLFVEHPQDASAAESQLSRAIAIALYSAGFTSARRRALDSFTDVVQEYMQHFSRRVAHSMSASRRQQPLPQDFIHALAAFGLTSSELEADLSLRIPPVVSQPAITTDTALSATTFIQPTGPFPTTTEPARQSRYLRHIPSHFPPLPPSHAYRTTPIFTARETDARRIREQATDEGVEAEKALRKLVKASKAGGRRTRLFQTGTGAVEGKALDKEEEIWKDMLSELDGEEMSTEPPGEQPLGELDFGMDGAGDARRGGVEGEDEAEAEAGMMVNYERAFWRKANRGGAVNAV